MNEKEVDDILTKEFIGELAELGIPIIDPEDLADAINSFPPLHIRMADDPEWTEDCWMYYSEITGWFSHWAVRQIHCGTDDCPFPYPKGFEVVLAHLDDACRQKFGPHLFQSSLCRIDEFLHNTLMSFGPFVEWNNTENGVLKKWWLDLHALIGNVIIGIRDERRQDKEFDENFERDWALQVEGGLGI